MEKKWAVLKKSEVKRSPATHPATVSTLTSWTPAYQRSTTRNYHHHPTISFHNFHTRNGLTSLSWNTTTTRGILSKIKSLTKRRWRTTTVRTMKCFFILNSYYICVHCTGRNKDFEPMSQKSFEDQILDQVILCQPDHNTGLLGEALDINLLTGRNPT